MVIIPVFIGVFKYLSCIELYRLLSKMYEKVVSIDAIISEDKVRTKKAFLMTYYLFYPFITNSPDCFYIIFKSMF